MRVRQTPLTDTNGNDNRPLIEEDNRLMVNCGKKRLLIANLLPIFGSSLILEGYCRWKLSSENFHTYHKFMYIY
jgi:hypothetical protein